MYNNNKKVKCFNNNSILEINNNRIVVGGVDEVTIINTSKYVIEQKVDNDKLNDISSLMILRDGNILCGCKQGIMCIYDIKKKYIIQNKIEKDDINAFLRIDERQFISCSNGRYIRVWEY